MQTMTATSQHTIAAARFRGAAQAALLAGDTDSWADLLELAENAEEMAALEADANRGE